ncbi:PREDICTED: uncharacterized protein LOC107071944 isoform X2 [Polistes dominula]|uniref:Uncharacterized protein LOC107071944 isoform X2 n=1 Tax=Polistes dominula TaxID=743375 RepID=A0ABM1J376_POLDO|nr:PREDICTED: uncharacterized protein LOC107071944 isoform X2 [Polistes dominula]
MYNNNSLHNISYIIDATWPMRRKIFINKTESDKMESFEKDKMESFETDKKLLEVLEIFLSPNYNITSVTYLDLLLTHIEELLNKQASLNQRHYEVLHKWVLQALNTWDSNSKPSRPIIIFTLKLVGIVASNELDFHQWQRYNVYEKLCSIIQPSDEHLSASVIIAYTQMLSNLIKHESGRKWVLHSGVWKDIVKCAHKNYTMYITHESQKFLWTLLLHEQENIPICMEIISAIADPLVKNSYNSQTHQTLEDSYLDENEFLCNTLGLITSIFENTLFISMDSNIPDFFEELYELEMRVKALFEACIGTRFLQHVHKLLLLLLFLKLKRGIRSDTKAIDNDVWQKFNYGICYISMMLLSKKYIVELIKTNKFLMIYWKKLRTLCEFTLPEQHKFEHQAIVLMILPLCICVRKDHIQNELFDMFINKIFDVTCMPVQRLLYNIRDVIWKSDLPLENICKISIDLLLEITNIMDRDVAVITFQTLCHILKNYLPNVRDGMKICSSSESSKTNLPDNSRKITYKSILEGDPIVDNPILLASLLNGLAVITEKFKLKWQECVETICLLSLAQGILNHQGILPMLCVKALKVCKLAIQNFMPPNLALLVDSDSHMNEIGPTFYKRLHDPNWEVRDSVLEVLNTIAIISEDKYPAFQDFLLSNQFVELAIDIALTDGESYVRASALIFISSTIRIKKLWDEKLSFFNFPDIIIKLYNNETEGIVRREAVILMKELYIYRKWKNTISCISEVMSVAAIFDLHWEVKISALEFWKHFIKSHLSDQGMLDGSFPNVTFSKEQRKIVALDENEIKRRLNKALDELARQNCLGVLLVTLKDDSDFEVCKASAMIINKLKTFLLKYKINDSLLEISSPKDSAVIDNSYVKHVQQDAPSVQLEKQPSNSHNIIDEIVNTNDAKLLANVYSNNSQENDNENTEKKMLKYISRVTKQDFLDVVFNSDIDTYIEEKSQWLKGYTNSLESILDDILTMHKQGDVNSMDCY